MSLVTRVRFWMWLAFGLLVLVAVAGCGTPASSQAALASQNKAVTVAHATVKAIPHAVVTKLVSTKLVTNPYASDKSLHWPAKVWAITYSGTFPAPIPCPSGSTTCSKNAIDFTSATIVINPQTDAVLETVEPAWHVTSK